MLKTPERILVLYATAPEDFAASALELRRKFGLDSRIHSALRGLVKRCVLTHGDDGRYRAGEALQAELGFAAD